MEKIPVSLDRYGNTSGTSIPLTICDRWGEAAGKELRLIMCGFGIGLSWGIVDAVVSSDDVLPIAYTDEYYTDGGLDID